MLPHRAFSALQSERSFKFWSQILWVLCSKFSSGFASHSLNCSDKRQPKFKLANTLQDAVWQHFNSGLIFGYYLLFFPVSLLCAKTSGIAQLKLFAVVVYSAQKLEFWIVAGFMSSLLRLSSNVAPYVIPFIIFPSTSNFLLNSTLLILAGKKNVSCMSVV